jgi:hypothetical protein
VLRYLFLSSALDRCGGQRDVPGRFTLRKENRYLFYRRMGDLQDSCGRVLKISPSPVVEPHTVQPVAFAILVALSRALIVSVRVTYYYRLQFE